VRVAGVQSEMELPFAGLHQPCTPMLDRPEQLPGRSMRHCGPCSELGAAAGLTLWALLLHGPGTVRVSR
jgi:hypothetical protein